MEFNIPECGYACDIYTIFNLFAFGETLMSPRPYVPLHLHTEYSLLDGATMIKDLVKKAKAANMPAVAITDHGVMYGAIELTKTAKEMGGIKPIIGLETYIIDGDIRDKHTKQ